MADCVHRINLPVDPPGVRDLMDKSSNRFTSVPGIFLEAFIIPKSSFITIKIPFLFLYFLPLDLPFPDRIFLLLLILVKSSFNPKLHNIE